MSKASKWAIAAGVVLAGLASIATAACFLCG